MVQEQVRMLIRAGTNNRGNSGQADRGSGGGGGKKGGGLLKNKRPYNN